LSSPIVITAHQGVSALAGCRLKNTPAREAVAAKIERVIVASMLDAVITPNGVSVFARTGNFCEGKRALEQSDFRTIFSEGTGHSSNVRQRICICRLRLRYGQGSGKATCCAFHGQPMTASISVYVNQRPVGASSSA